MRNGYNIDEVNKHIEGLERIISEYKEKDAAIANTMISAQIAADNIIKNANLAAKSIRQETVEHLNRVSESLDKQKNLITRFEQDYCELVEKYLMKVNETEFKDTLTRVDELGSYLSELKGVAVAALEEPAQPAPIAYENQTSQQAEEE